MPLVRRSSTPLAALALATALLGCAASNRQPRPRYKPAPQLRGCGASECVEAQLELRPWADTRHRRGRLIYHCDPGSELDGREDPEVERLILVIHGHAEPSQIPAMTMAPGLGQLLAIRSAMSLAAERDPSFDPSRVAIIAPTFQRAGEWQPYTDEDPRMWAWSGSSYNTGGLSEEGRGRLGGVKAEPVSSFEILDELLRQSLVKFPQLQQIVLVGHSAGAQAVHRYALLGVGVHEHLEKQGVRLRYVVANPGLYAFPLRRRKLPPGRAQVPPGRGQGDTQHWRWSVPKACPGYDDWGHGLAGLPERGDERGRRSVDYAIEQYLRPVDRKLARRGRHNLWSHDGQQALRRALWLQYASREVWHLQAARDYASTFGDSCKATSQGRSRFERFSNFQEAWLGLLGVDASNLHFVAVEHLHDQHDARAIYTSEAGLHLLFR
ncbi:hypothetical protein G6O69_15505 [Pseudenhygromyxa sp. WMMC2535]|uniref:hypothetical protein n=1 Tax=Pseudenhygromyxa sp. WMMC2535 TaxID=2712867 RepID=UPI00155524EF|nr:hypothetical protein [Pseudenhygromyxa sp. WMMC2535]NVB39249.1 hypothetical protein [Pseudenhygromyxa sp. WMMC2535]